MTHNTTDHLVADLERLREHLGIGRWVVVGGSWGTTLGLIYAERYPHRVSEILVSAISTARRSEIDWLYRGVGQFFPEAWERFRDAAGSPGRDVDLPSAYATLMEDSHARNRAAATWMWWEDTVLSLEPGAAPPVFSEPPDNDALAFARIVTHYYSHGAWIDEGAVIRDAGRLAGIPGVLIHGRLDLSCPVATAWELARGWPGAELLIDDQSGHLGSLAKRTWMVETLDRFAQQ
jgi:proline iminopeptidase